MEVLKEFMRASDNSEYGGDMTVTTGDDYTHTLLGIINLREEFAEDGLRAEPPVIMDPASIRVEKLSTALRLRYRLSTGHQPPPDYQVKDPVPS